MLLEGLHIPLTTPFYPDGRLNLHKLASNITRYSKTPAAGIIVLGPSGEPTLLSDDETREVLRAAAESAAPEKILVAGISRDSVPATLALADYAAELSYDAVLIGVPSVLAPISIAHERSETRLREVLTYFQTLADRSPLPVILLSTSGRAVHANSVIELASHPNIIGVITRGDPFAFTEILARTSTIQREVTVTPTFAAVTARMEIAAAGSAGAAMLILADSLTGPVTSVAEPFIMSPPLRTRTKTIGFQILARDAQTMLDSLGAGAVGVAPDFAACAPQVCYEVFAAWKDEDKSLAREKQDRLREAAYQTEHALGAGGLKFACDLNGYYGGLPRLPHLPPNGEERDALEQHMKSLRS